uniref:XK-related protein n=1 Tax=Pelodiscus sinensis TaxID=13735 RepID=K7GJG9_PELSI|nr:XK-related protein 9 [Pelodiscus sinensis]XP_014433248.1 XK-related protein 9 [Pelodiscus sinensis]XP_025044670.1 XK-related protein 9 [Pelodiscus sinensis]|eukprot:XP_006131570.1 XK-related protein 9 [Pelodiscus sinensis]
MTIMKINPRKFTKWNFTMSVLGIVIYIADIAADLWVASNYFCERQYYLVILTLAFRLLASVIVQTFSYAWLKEDCNIPDSEKFNWIFLLHFLHGGIFTRYWFALKDGYQAAFKHNSSGNKLTESTPDDIHKCAIDAVTDISMLRVFKTFLETTPQLILQIYILMEHDKVAFSQYASIITSFCSISWSTLDYQISLRKSLLDKNQFAGVRPRLMYLLYKLFTLTSWILSIALTTILSIVSSLILLISLWTLGFSWTLKQHTTFCKSKRMEFLYRTVVGVILIFTFFNVKGEKTKMYIVSYYTTHVLVTLAVMCGCLFWKTSVTEQFYFPFVSITIVLTLGAGIICLIIYYSFFHPTIYFKQDSASDTVDGLAREREKEGISRIRNFIMQ